ncbi:hypothetical protein HDV63DRAFT_372738 [Trichoderma sp. SZMC 28014]
MVEQYLLYQITIWFFTPTSAFSPRNYSSVLPQPDNTPAHPNSFSALSALEAGSQHQACIQPRNSGALAIVTPCGHSQCGDAAPNAAARNLRPIIQI